jgi:WD40 repeat protein
LSGIESAVAHAELSGDGRLALTLEKGEVRRSVYRNAEGNRSFSGGEQNRKTTVRLWDVAAGKQTRTLEAQGRIVWAALSLDGRRALTVADTQVVQQGRLVNPPSVCLWDTKTGKKLLTLNEGGAPDSRAAFSPDGRQVVTVKHGSLKVWDAVTGKEEAALPGGGGLTLARFSPDGAWVVSLSIHERPRLWQAQTGRVRVIILKGHELAVNDAAFSPDGRLVATASDDETVRIWEVATGREVYTLTGHEGPVRAVVFSPDGKRLATASQDGTARVWLLDLVPAALARKPRQLTEPERRRFEVPAPGR